MRNPLALAFESTALEAIEARDGFSHHRIPRLSYCKLERRDQAQLTAPGLRAVLNSSRSQVERAQAAGTLLDFF